MTSTSLTGDLFYEENDPKRKVIKKAGEFYLQEKRIPKHRQELLKLVGWGYNDSEFVCDKNGMFSFSGSRYSIAGTKLPNFGPTMKQIFDLDAVNFPRLSMTPKIDSVPEPILDSSFVEAMQRDGIESSSDAKDRLFRSHSQNTQAVYKLINGWIDRYVDFVVWPKSHEDCVKIMQAAILSDIALIPFGGGSCVSEALECDANEKRMIVSVDTSQMNKILYIDEENFLVRAQAGIVGLDLEKLLSSKGYHTGHEPDSMEFSSLGGWIATRCSGMKKNVYGNIEQLVVHMKIVTPRGVIEKGCQVPRLSAGPDIHEVFLGSEGTLGIITEATIKIRPVPTIVRYGSYVFPSMELGFQWYREIAKRRIAPSSVRLMDSDQLLLGQLIKPEPTSYLASAMESAKKFYLTRFKGLDLKKIAVATLVFEGSNEDEVTESEKRIDELATRFQGLSGGEDQGKRGYAGVYAIAYIRDIGYQFHIIGESIETSVPWDRALALGRNVKERVRDEAGRLGITPLPYIAYRITQGYDSGCCMYFYFCFNARSLSATPSRVCVDTLEAIEHSIRDEMMASGGSVSHHHGIGKMRARFMRQTVGSVGLQTLVAVKRHLDPKNNMAAGNLFTRDDWDRAVERTDAFKPVIAKL